MTLVKTRVRARAIGALLVGVAASWVGCSNTQIEQTWKDPAVKPTLTKVAVVCLSREEGLRRMCEDETVQQMGTGTVLQSYVALGDVPLGDREAVKARLRSQGFDGVLMMRFAGASEQVNVGPAPVSTFDTYYPWAYGMAYTPTVDTIVRMVANLYSLPLNRLVWSGSSKTFDPSSARTTVESVSRAVGRELKKNHLLI
jgi:hypothetical protein